MSISGVQVRRLLRAATIADDDRRLAGAVSGWLYLLGALTLAVMVFLPGIPAAHRTALLVVAATVAVGAVALLTAMPWHRVPAWGVHPLQAVALSLTATVVALSGESMSPAWVYLLLCAFFAAYFYARPVAVMYLCACVAVQALPLLYDSRALHDRFLAELVTGAPTYVALGVVVNAGKRRVEALRARAEVLAGEQAALRRVASAVAGGATPEHIFAMVAAEVADLLGASAAAIMRLEADGSLVIAGSWARTEHGALPPGTVVPVPSGSPVERCLQTGRAQSTARHGDGGQAREVGAVSSSVAAVTVAGAQWGILAVASECEAAFDGADVETLQEFGDLLATAVSSAEERARMAAEALTDSLTGLANQRALHGRLDAELARAARHDRPLSIAIIDVDHFKEVNDTSGHETGDRMLERVAATLASFARAEDTLARVGGDEFAWVMPDTSREQALVAVERARRHVGTAPADPLRVTISAGICDTESADDASELLRRADSALYWSKAHGRDQAWIYDPGVISELSERQRAEGMRRAQSLLGLRALVRAQEEREPRWRAHSERVAELAARLATAAGWPRERGLLLAQAALVHDVGAIAGEPLPVAWPMGPAEIEARRSGAALSARLVDGLLGAEQVGWIAAQYRPPVAVAPASLLSGGSLMALADTWDTLTAVAPGMPGDALSECERLCGVCFDGGAVGVLGHLYRAGELGGGPAGSSVGSPV